MKLKPVNLDQVHHRETVKYNRYIAAALLAAANGADAKTAFDSTTAESGLERPQVLDQLYEKMPEGQENQVLGAILDGCSEYERENGIGPSPDLIEAAVAAAHGVFTVKKDLFGNPLFDSATSSNHDQISLQPNRAVTAIIRTIAEGIPFAGYLPVDIGSNQSKLIIAQTMAGSNFGGYSAQASLEGVNCGRNYTLASRVVTMGTANNTLYTVQIFSKDLATGEPDTTSNAVAVLRGRTGIFVNGLFVGGEAPSSNGTGATSPITGTVVLAGTTFTFTGTVTIATGAISVTFSAALPAGTDVRAKAFIDFESAPGLIPRVDVIATAFDIFATESRVFTANAFGAAQQMRNEAGLDPETLATAKFQDQHTYERYYQFLKWARINGMANNPSQFDMDFSSRGTQLTRAMIIQDLAAVIGRLSKTMANNTMDHGITPLYTGAWMGSVLEGCPDFIWKPSGVPARAGIYRMGTLFGIYEVYYTPNGITEAADGSTSEIICIGVSTQPARNPFLMGDAVPPTLLPLATGTDLKRQAAFYVRDFSEVNPHQPSALGCAYIAVINIK